jgi:hypothetical protein
MKPQPLSFKRRLLWSLELFWRNLLSQLGLALLSIIGLITTALIGMVVGIADVMTLPMVLSGPDGMSSPPDPFAMMNALFAPGVLVALLLVLLVAGVLMFWSQAALYQIAADSLMTGERAKLRTSLKKSFARLPDFMTTIGLVMIIVLLAELATALFAAATGGAIVGIVIGVASIILIIWLSLTFVMAGPIALLENHDPLGTLSRTWHLVNGMRWRMLGHFLLLALTIIVVSLLAWAPLLLGTMVGGIIAAILGFISFILWIVVTMGIIFVSLFFGESFYFEARAIKGHWKAGWGEVPDESWQLSDIPDDVEILVNSRGLRSWLEFMVLSVILMAAIYGSALLLPSPSSMLMMQHSTQMGAPMAGRHNMHNQLSPSVNITMAPDELSIDSAFDASVQPTAAAGLNEPSAAADGRLRINLTQDNFWSDSNNPSLWLKASINGITLPSDGIDLSNILRIEISTISNRSGENIYNGESPMEDQFFQQVNLQSDGDRLHGIRNIQLLKGSTMADIIAIKGVLTLTLPAEIEKFSIRSSDVGSHFEAQALTVALTSMENSALAIEATGLDIKRRLLGVVAIGDSAADGDADRQGPRSWSSSAIGEAIQFHYDFDEPLEQAELYIANQIIEKHQSFTLNHKSATIELD